MELLNKNEAAINTMENETKFNNEDLPIPHFHFESSVKSGGNQC